MPQPIDLDALNQQIAPARVLTPDQVHHLLDTLLGAALLFRHLAKGGDRPPTEHCQRALGEITRDLGALGVAGSTAAYRP